MADKIEKLDKFMEACKREWNAEHEPVEIICSILIHRRLHDILEDKINEAEYIKQWVKEII